MQPFNLQLLFFPCLHQNQGTIVLAFPFFVVKFLFKVAFITELSAILGF